MSAGLNDEFLLSQDTGFQGRVRAAIVSAAVAITTEAWTVPFHRERQNYAIQILNTSSASSPDTYKLLFAASVATDANCIGDATQGGTVALTTSNAQAQAALVTDAHINAAVSGQFNSFFRTPAN